MFSVKLGQTRFTSMMNVLMENQVVLLSDNGSGYMTFPPKTATP
ncbi:MAG: hypothetical protein PHI12_00020 [Dehalococcoidales bacterium]|nr:hypothetical protein [Dehalococcoidales bacterium]